MAPSKLRRSKKQIHDLLTPRIMHDDDPAVYTPEERKVLIEYGLKYLRGVMKGRRVVAFHEDAEAFRRKVEIIHILRGLAENLRKRPTGQETKDAVHARLECIGIKCSDRTLARDYRALGGAKTLRSVKPFAPGEDTSYPFLKVS